MLKKTITYTDYNGDERTEDFYFNISRGEMLDMQLSTPGGYDTKIQQVLDSRDYVSMYAIFKDLVNRSYGIKSDDGKRFIKSEKLLEEFKQTEAYSNLFMEFVQSPDFADTFVNGVFPKGAVSDVAKADALPASE